MATTIRIKLTSNKETGKREILIDHESEEDATPHEHEQDHLRAVEALVGKGLLTEEEAAEAVSVHRVRPQAQPNGQVQQEAPQREAASNKG
jgi:hypothetical protein